MVTQIDSHDRASAEFIALDPKAVAFLLDVDGTLIDIGPSPFAVHVPDDLRASLARLAEQSAGALALVSGRPIADLDRLFGALNVSAIGGHGAEMRIGDVTINRGVALLPQDFRDLLAAAAGPDVLIEDKGYSLAMHFRGAPEQKPRLLDAVAKARAAFPQEAVEVLPGKAMLEVKRPLTNKGSAVRALMTHAPFSGRRAVFIGDDVTDESVFAVLPQLGGLGFSVGRHFEGQSGVFDSPAAVRAALRTLAARKDKR